MANVVPIGMGPDKKKEAKSKGTWLERYSSLVGRSTGGRARTRLVRL